MVNFISGQVKLISSIPLGESAVFGFDVYVRVISMAAGWENRQKAQGVTLDSPKLNWPLAFTYKKRQR